MQHITSFVVGLSIQDLQEWIKFDNIHTIFLNKTSGQTWCQKSQMTYNLKVGTEGVPFLLLPRHRSTIRLENFRHIISSEK